MALGFPAAVRNAMLDAITTYAGSAAILRIYSGSKPALGGAETTKLAQASFSGNIASAASGGVLTLLVSGLSDTSADATGTASWARIYKSDAATIVADMTVTATGGGGDLTLDNTAITVGGTVTVTAGTITAGNAS